MQPATFSIFCLMLFLNAQLFSALPMYSGKWTNNDVNVLKVLLRRLEEETLETEQVTPYQAQMSERMPFGNSSPKESSGQLQEKIYQVKQFLSAKDLKALRSNSSSNRLSGCFGRKMDRIGAMNHLGCKTLGKKHN